MVFQATYLITRNIALLIPAKPIISIRLNYRSAGDMLLIIGNLGIATELASPILPQILSIFRCFPVIAVVAGTSIYH